MRIRYYISLVLVFILASFTFVINSDKHSVQGFVYEAASSNTHVKRIAFEKRVNNLEQDIDRTVSHDTYTPQFNFGNNNIAKIQTVEKASLLFRYLSYLDNSFETKIKTTSFLSLTSCIPIYRLLIYPKHWFW